jgi:hypothetical protein
MIERESTFACQRKRRQQDQNRNQFFKQFHSCDPLRLSADET